jgi:hypothetical protein
MNDDWVRLDSDTDGFLESLAEEQSRVLRDGVPAQLGQAFSEVYGDGWESNPAIAAQFAQAVQLTRERFATLIAASTQQFERDRARGFRGDQELH